MYESLIKVEPYKVFAHCSECREELKWTGMQYTVHPPLYPHECKNGHKESLRKVYPCIEYK